jgi:hypothetical protein
LEVGRAEHELELVAAPVLLDEGGVVVALRPERHRRPQRDEVDVARGLTRFEPDHLTVDLVLDVVPDASHEVAELGGGAVSVVHGHLLLRTTATVAAGKG